MQSGTYWYVWSVLHTAAVLFWYTDIVSFLYTDIIVFFIQKLSDEIYILELRCCATGCITIWNYNVIFELDRDVSFTGNQLHKCSFLHIL